MSATTAPSRLAQLTAQGVIDADLNAVVPTQQPEMAAREVDRVGGHPGFVQVYLPVRAEAPYGNRRYLPLLEAAVRHDLTLGIGFGGQPPNPPTPSGWPSYYIEEWAGM